MSTPYRKDNTYIRSEFSAINDFMDFKKQLAIPECTIPSASTAHEGGFKGELKRN
jgi:hypothetical protein